LLVPGKIRQEVIMIKRFMLSSLAISALAAASLVSAPADAKEGRNGAFAAGAAAGVVGGALLGSAARPSYETEHVYVEPECRWRRERYFDGYEYRTRRVEICD
jgi:hypothetical protein